MYVGEHLNAILRMTKMSCHWQIKKTNNKTKNKPIKPQKTKNIKGLGFIKKKN